MNLANLKIKTQLQIGFALIIIFVLGLGTVAWSQTAKIAEQTKLLYNHPFRVRRALGDLRADIFFIHKSMVELTSSKSEAEIADYLSKIDAAEADTWTQVDELYSQYLGSRADVDQVKQELLDWETIRGETIRLVREGKMEEARARTQPGGKGGKQAELLLSTLDAISIFAQNKAEEFYATSQKLAVTLNYQLSIIVGGIVFLTLVIVYFLLRNIQKPLKNLTSATEAFRNGDLSARSSYSLKNEFGDLSESFNQLAKTIQLEMELKEKTANLSGLMMGLNDAAQFFQPILTKLAELSGSQMSAVYLLSTDQQYYKHFASIGMNDVGRSSFAADGFDGVFGAALVTKKIQHIASIPADTRFTFSTMNGGFIPREIITIPVVSENQVVAILALATITGYTKQDLGFINEIWQTLNARVVGILAFRQIQTLAIDLEQQNRELETQKSELNAQAVELNQQNRELDVQKRQLSEASQLKTSFISNMSHELRTPLNSVIALSGVLNRRLAALIPPEEFSYLEVIERNGKQLLALINDILDLSRIESGREEIEISKFDVNLLLAEVVSIIKPLAQQKNIELLSTPSSTMDSMINDYAKCRHILQNLVGNAVKFTEAGQVEIRAEQKGKDIQISVSDTGIGISKENLTHIFDEFRQADNSTSRRYGGTGLGLTIAKKYAEILGGNLMVKSSLGKGSVFTLTLPQHLEQDLSSWEADSFIDMETAAAVLAQPMSSSPNSQKTILVVEDSEPAIIQLRDIFEEHAYNVLVARNGQEALNVIELNVPDAILLDLMMPGMDGFKVLQTVRNAERTALVPVLILTAKQITKEELKFLKRNNVHQLIQKGDINRSELLSAVSNVVNPKIEKIKTAPSTRSEGEGKDVVLVVEDNADNMLTVKALLADKFDVIEAVDGKVAVEKALNYKPHLILMDIALPGMDGLEAFKIIRSKTATQNIPVIALTASVMQNDRETILAAGFDAFLAKPIDHKEFKQTIERVLYGK